MRNDSLGTPMKLDKNEIAIFEGIHALNDDIAGRHPEATKLYISARSNVSEGAVLRFKGTWMRLTRRAVRDYNFRGTGVAETLEMWANVRRGEKLYISPSPSSSPCPRRTTATTSCCSLLTPSSTLPPSTPPWCPGTPCCGSSSAAAATSTTEGPETFFILENAE